MDKSEHADDEFVAALGHKPVLQRNFSFLSMLELAFLDSWMVLSVSVSLALPSGGPSAVVWGLVGWASWATRGPRCTWFTTLGQRLT